MTTKNWFTILIMLLGSVYVFQSCNINEPYMPSWDVSVNVPIIKKDYTLLDIIEKSKELSYYKEGVNKNLIYYSKTESVNEIDLQNQLSIDGFTKSSSESIGTIKLSSDSVNAEVDFSWIGPNIVPGQKLSVPKLNESPASSALNAANQFTSIKLLSGNIDFTIRNNFPTPVTITLTNLIVRDNISGAVVASYNPATTLSPDEIKTIKQIPLTTGISISNKLTFECKITTAGSGAWQIIVPQSSFSVKVKFNSLEVDEAVAKIPVQDPIVIDNTTTIDQSSSQPTKYQFVKIDQGTISLQVSNNIDVDAQVIVSSTVLRDASNQLFSTKFDIARKQQNISVLNISLKDYMLVSTSGATNQIPFSITINTKFTNDNRTIKSSDDVHGTITVGKLSLKEFSGVLKPRSIDLERSAISLNAKDLQSKLQFQQLNLYNPIVQFALNTNAQFEFKIEGRIEAKKPNGQKVTMGLNYRTLDTTVISPSNYIVTIKPDSIRKFFMQFSNFPDSLISYVGGILNPNYRSISVRNTDKISGQSKLELPMEFGISNAVYKDSVNIELSNDDRDNIKKLNSLAATLKIANSIPASIQFSSKLYDEFNNYLLDFPLSVSQSSVINVPGSATSETRIALNASDSEKLSRAKYLRTVISLNTIGANNSPVKFRTTDNVQIHAFGSANYRVKTSGSSK